MRIECRLSLTTQLFGRESNEYLDGVQCSIGSEYELLDT